MRKTLLTHHANVFLSKKGFSGVKSLPLHGIDSFVRVRRVLWQSVTSCRINQIIAIFKCKTDVLKVRNYSIPFKFKLIAHVHRQTYFHSHRRTAAISLNIYMYVFGRLQRNQRADDQWTAMRSWYLQFMFVSVNVKHFCLIHLIYMMRIEWKRERKTSCAASAVVFRWIFLLLRW